MYTQENLSVNAVMNSAASRSQGYVRHEVAGDGDCGYTSFGITREDARALLLNNIGSIAGLITLPVRAALLTEDFFKYLSDQGIIAVTHADIVDNEELLERYSTDLAVQGAYIQYDVGDRRIDAGYSHPAILQALAHIQNVEIHMWRLGEDDILVPHNTSEANYAAYVPEGSNQRVDILFINNNHFERLDLSTYEDNIPENNIYPLERVWLHKHFLGGDNTEFFEQSFNQYLLNEEELDRAAKIYNPFLIRKLLFTVSQNLTYHSLIKLSFFASEENLGILEKVKLNLSEVLTNSTRQIDTEKAYLEYALCYLNRTFTNLPTVLSHHIIQLKSLIADIDEENRKEIYKQLKETQKKNSAAIQANASQNFLPLLLTSAQDVDSLLFASVNHYKSQKKIFSKNLKNFTFFDELIERDIRACGLLKKQIEALRDNLINPANQASQLFDQFKKDFYKNTQLPDMSIESTIDRLGVTHKNIEFLKEIRTQVDKLSEMENKWFEMIDQNAALKNFGNMLQINVKGVFDLPPVNSSLQFRHRITDFIQLLNKRIEKLNKQQSEALTSTIQNPLPLLSLTFLLTENPERFYLYPEKDELSLYKAVNGFISENSFISEEELQDTLEDFMPLFSPNESRSIVFEINVLKLLTQFSSDISKFCEDVDSINLFDNQVYYFSSLAKTVLHEVLSLKNILKRRITDKNSKLKLNWINSLAERLNSIESSVRSTSWVLDCLKEQLTNQHIDDDLTYRSDTLGALGGVYYYLDRSEPFEAIKYLNHFYQASIGDESDEINKKLSELENRLSEQMTNLLYETDAIALLATPLQLIFSRETHPDSDVFIRAFKHYSNKLSLFVQFTLLDEEHTPLIRSKTYSRWLRVAIELHKKGDFLGYIAITLGLDNMKEFRSSVELLGPDDYKLFKDHVKLHKNFMPRVLKSDISIPYPESFLGEIEKISGLSKQVGCIGFLNKNDSRLYGDQKSYLQVMYHHYQKHHEFFLGQFSGMMPNPDSWRRHIDTIHNIELSVDDNIRCRDRARQIESAYRETVISPDLSSTPCKPLEINPEVIFPEDIFDLAYNIKQLPHSSNLNQNRGIIFDENSYLHLNSLNNIPNDMQAQLISKSSVSIELRAYGLGLFMNPDAFYSLFKVLKREEFQSIRKLDLHRNISRDLPRDNRYTYFQELQLLSRIAPYQSVNLSDNSIDNGIFSLLIRPLESFIAEDRFHIQQLSLQGNQLGLGSYQDGSFSLGRFLRQYNRLVYLDLNDNFLTERDAEPLAKALLRCNSLREIDLGMNAFGDSGIKKLCAALASLPKLEVVKFYCCKLTDESASTIKDLINSRGTIIDIIFDGNHREAYLGAVNDGKLHHSEKNSTEIDNAYQGMQQTTEMYLNSLLAVRRDSILADAERLKPVFLGGNERLSFDNEVDLSNQLVSDPEKEKSNKNKPLPYRLGNKESRKNLLGGRNTTSKAQKSTSEILKKLNNLGLSFQEVKADGHCLYHAIGLHIGQDAQSLRNSIADNLERNRAEQDSVIRALLRERNQVVEEENPVTRFGA